MRYDQLICLSGKKYRVRELMAMAAEGRSGLPILEELRGLFGEDVASALEQTGRVALWAPLELAERGYRLDQYPQLVKKIEAHLTPAELDYAKWTYAWARAYYSLLREAEQYLPPGSLAGSLVGEEEPIPTEAERKVWEFITNSCRTFLESLEGLGRGATLSQVVSAVDGKVPALVEELRSFLGKLGLAPRSPE